MDQKVADRVVDRSKSDAESPKFAAGPAPGIGMGPGAKKPGRPALTDRQRRVLEYINDSIKSRGYPPTLREIGEHMSIRSTNGVNDHLRALEKKGFLERHDLKSRGLRITAPEFSGAAPQRASSSDDDTVAVPVLGKVAAGQPILAYENREDTVHVDRFFLGAHRDVFALRVKGDSMIEAGIHDGDYLFVKKQPVAHTGDIVVAMINDEATVKYFYPESERIVFKPANSRLSPIEVKKSEFKPVNLLGTVVGVYRKMC
jgi:repressor LexA